MQNRDKALRTTKRWTRDAEAARACRIILRPEEQRCNG
jgi:hypothetical protein